MFAFKGKNNLAFVSSLNPVLAWILQFELWMYTISYDNPEEWEYYQLLFQKFSCRDNSIFPSFQRFIMLLTLRDSADSSELRNKTSEIWEIQYFPFFPSKELLKKLKPKSFFSQQLKYKSGSVGQLRLPNIRGKKCRGQEIQYFPSFPKKHLL